MFQFPLTPRIPRLLIPKLCAAKTLSEQLQSMSGASLHCEIINEFFSGSEEDGKKHEASEHISVIRFQGPDSKSWNAFHTHPHELGSFPLMNE